MNSIFNFVEKTEVERIFHSEIYTSFKWRLSKSEFHQRCRKGLKISLDISKNHTRKKNEKEEIADKFAPLKELKLFENLITNTPNILLLFPEVRWQNCMNTTKTEDSEGKSPTTFFKVDE